MYSNSMNATISILKPCRYSLVYNCCSCIKCTSYPSSPVDCSIILSSLRRVRPVSVGQPALPVRRRHGPRSPHGHSSRRRLRTVRPAEALPETRVRRARPLSPVGPTPGLRELVYCARRPAKLPEKSEKSDERHLIVSSLPLNHSLTLPLT